MPAEVLEVVLEVEVAGRRFKQKHPPTPNRTTTFTWDGRDAYGRRPYGGQTVRVRVGWVYPIVYYEAREDLAASFALVTTSGAPIQDGRLESRPTVTFYQEFDLAADATGSFDARAQCLGAWTVDVHHAYDWAARVVHLGNGERRSVAAFDRQIATLAGTGVQCGEGADRTPCGEGGDARDALLSHPSAVAVGADGSVYVAERSGQIVTRVGRDGRYTRVAGVGLFGFGGDGGPATEAPLYHPSGLAVGPDDSLYIADPGNAAVRRVAPDGVITTVAGNPHELCTDAPFFRCGDGRPATFAGLFVHDVAVAADGTRYISEPEAHRIRRVGTDGILTTFAGTGFIGDSGDGGPATAARLSRPTGIALGPDGSLYIADSRNRRVRRVGIDGFIHTVAGTGEACDAHGSACGDGGPASEARIDQPEDVAVADDGALLIAESREFLGSPVQRIRLVRPDGTIITAAGGGTEEVGSLRPPATAAELEGPLGVAVGPDGGFYVSDLLASRVYEVEPPLPGLSEGQYLIPAEDGGEVHVFDPRGRHLRTVDGLGGALVRRFEYDPPGLLARIVEGDGSTTRIERDPGGVPMAIVAPSGERTTLGLDAHGYLASITDPTPAETRVRYTDDGLLTRFTNARNHTS